MSIAYKHRRWSDNDKHLGPFLYSRDQGSKRFGLIAISGGDKNDDDAASCHLRLHAFGHTLICDLPPILKPWRRWVDMTKYDWHKGPGDGYWDVHAVQYGFMYGEGFLQVFHGPQTGDSETTRSWCKFLPWTQLHFHRHTYRGLNNEVLREWIEPRRRQRGGSLSRYDEQREFKESMPKVAFEFDDFDGARIVATTHIEEREWTFGEGSFQWLRFFRRNKVSRSLALDFSAEVGPEKGSWKGGTTGHSIEMLPGELHEAAFRRYCEQDHRSKYRPFKITFIGRAPT